MSKSIVMELNKDFKLNGDNYKIWSTKVQYLLEEQEVFDSLSSIMAKPEEGTTSQYRKDLEAYMAWRKKNSTARIVLLSAMDDDITKQFNMYENAMDIWTALKHKFGSVSLTKLRALAFKFDTYKMSYDHTMKIHLREMSSMISELTEAGQKMTEEQKIQAVIRSLRESWDHMRMHLIQTESIRTFEDVARHLELEEDRLTSIKNNVEAHFIGKTSVENRSNKRKCFNEQAQEPKKPKQGQEGDKLSTYDHFDLSERSGMPGIQIFAKTRDRQTISLHVESSDTIGNLKAKIQAIGGIPPYKRLMFCSFELMDDEKTLAECCIQVWSTIHMW
ncbi:uncharacterized protein [Euphorbia lathyris]|uniref:uncharacterized protein n=1 Tax=Euphorbia lathyris TaxID=212925 RepID=UPI0033131E11